MALADQLFSQLDDTRRRNAGNAACPTSDLGDAVAFAQQVGAQLRLAGTVTGEERLVHHMALGDFVAKRQHQCHVGIGANRDPVSLYPLRAVIEHRTDIDHRRAFGRQLFQRRFQAVLTGAPACSRG